MMHTTRLPTIRVSVATTRCQYHAGVGPQVNKSEQVSNDDHQMSVVGVMCLVWEGVPMSQCIMGNGHMEMPLKRITDRHL